jgi:hypothetical protein
MNAYERPTIPYSELAPASPDSPLALAWECYRREVAQLIAAGHEGKWLLIRGNEVIGLYDTEDQALDLRAARFLGQPVLVQQIRVCEPVQCSLPRYHPTEPESAHSLHYTQLPPAPRDSLFCTEWEFYRQEVGRLLAAGHEGKWLLIQGNAVVGLCDTEDQALDLRAERFFGQPVLVQQLRVREPVLLITPRM